MNLAQKLEFNMHFAENFKKVFISYAFFFETSEMDCNGHILQLRHKSLVPLNKSNYSY